MIPASDDDTDPSPHFKGQAHNIKHPNLRSRDFDSRLKVDYDLRSIVLAEVIQGKSPLTQSVDLEITHSVSE
jgi:hypothetical protein